MADHKTIARIVAELSAAYPSWSATEYTTEIYYQDLKDIPDDELLLAAQHCRVEAGRKFAPSVGEIRGAVAELRSVASNVPSPYQAWQEVQTQILENGGEFGRPVWSHPLVERAVQQIGWRNLRMSENEVADRARFLQCYEQLVQRAARDEMLLPEVRGYIDANGAEQVKLLAEKWSINK